MRRSLGALGGRFHGWSESKRSSLIDIVINIILHIIT